MKRSYNYYLGQFLGLAMLAKTISNERIRTLLVEIYKEYKKDGGVL